MKLNNALHIDTDASIDAVMASIDREARKGHRFDSMSDLVEHDVRVRGYVAAQRVA